MYGGGVEWICVGFVYGLDFIIDIGVVGFGC